MMASQYNSSIDGPLPDTAVTGSASHPPVNILRPSVTNHIHGPRSSEAPGSGSGSGAGVVPGPDLATLTALAAAQPNGPDVAALAAMNLQPLPQHALRRRPAFHHPPNNNNNNNNHINNNNPNPNDAVLQAARELRWLKQTTIDRFEAWHLGRDQWCRGRGDVDSERMRSIARIPIPPRRYPWPGHQQPGAAGPAGTGVGAAPIHLSRLNMIGQPRRLRRLLQTVMPRPPRKRAKVAVAGMLQRQLAVGFTPAGWKFKRRLGMGGFGAVFLFEMVGENGLKVPVVVKGSIRAGRGLFEEYQHIVLMSGAPHFIQRVIMSSLPLPEFRKKARNIVTNALSSALSKLGLSSSSSSGITNYASPAILQAPSAATGNFQADSQSPAKSAVLNSSSADASDVGVPAAAPPRRQHSSPSPPQQAWTQQQITAIQRARWTLDARRDIIILENMARGSVADLIEKMVARSQRLSNRALWLVFECLFKGCLAMAYPTSSFQPGVNPWAETMPLRDETVPNEYRGGRLNDAPLVHFDLDPQNALIGDFGLPGGDHDFVPIFKIADPGLALVVDVNMQNDEGQLWAARLRGKPDFYQPEQFTREWDHQAAVSLAHLQREPVAGNYHWWSNLYQVGWIMWALVTHCHPPWPPRALPYEYPAEHDSTGPDDGRQGWTYGMHMMDDARYGECDFELRVQIMRCLDHNPIQRPTAEWFERVVAYNVTRDDLLHAESDEQLREAVSRIFRAP